MIGKCYACQYELEEAYRLQEVGFYIATYDNWPETFPNTKGHYSIIAVDRKGRRVV